jgi:hypothetical protein
VKKATSQTFLLLGAAALAGCTALRGAPEAPRPTSVAQADPAYLVESASLAKYNTEPNLETKKLIRNEIIDERVLEIDSQFGNFELALWQQGVGTGTGTDWVQLAVSGATATVGGESVKAALGAVSTGIIGAKASFDKNAFFDKTLPAILAQMVATRESIRANIERSKQLSVSEYTLFAALSDIRAFIRAGTIAGGIQSISEDAGEKTTKADKDIKDIRTARFVKDESGDRLRTFWKPDGKTVDPVNEGRLKQWMQQNGLATGPGDITLFLRGEPFADLRVRAVQTLLQ